MKKNSTITMEKEDLIESLKFGYEEYKTVSKQEDEVELAHIKGFCSALEQIGIFFGSMSNEEIAEIKYPIIGKVSMKLSKKVNLDEPSYIRRKKHL